MKKKKGTMQRMPAARGAWGHFTAPGRPSVSGTTPTGEDGPSRPSSGPARGPAAARILGSPPCSPGRGEGDLRGPTVPSPAGPPQPRPRACPAPETRPRVPVLAAGRRGPGSAAPGLGAGTPGPGAGTPGLGGDFLGRALGEGRSPASSVAPAASLLFQPSRFSPPPGAIR